MKKPKFIVILGSIMSGLGKGILTSSILKILDLRGIKALPIKFDGYLNVDCGTMNPFRHGEVFVLEDGAEVDMDFGTYERFLGKNLDRFSSITGGKIFKKIIEDERKGVFLGEDVQFIPHVTNFIKNYLLDFAKTKDLEVVVIEVGGTIGDIENTYFVEALRQLAINHDVLFIQLTYLPFLGGIYKTKPTQHANRLIQSFGIKPSIIVGRIEKGEELDSEIKQKIALFCNVKERDVYEDPNFSYIYEMPLFFEEKNLFSSISSFLNIEEKKKPDWKEWRIRVERLKNPKSEVNIAIVGKYTKVKDAYVSIEEALIHSSADLGIKVNKELIDSSVFAEEKNLSLLDRFDGIIIPGGFGKRGIEGKINAIKYARENKKPLLGICLGMQLMIVEFFRNVLGIKEANSLEFEKTEYDVITLLPEQKSIVEKGGTMRLGSYPMEIIERTKLYEIYKKPVVYERHRHRYEVNPKFVKYLGKGLIVSAYYKGIVEAVEYENGLGIGTQAHPELNSKFENPSPLFNWLVKTANKEKGF